MRKEVRGKESWEKGEREEGERERKKGDQERKESGQRRDRREREEGQDTASSGCKYQHFQWHLTVTQV